MGLGTVTGTQARTCDTKRRHDTKADALAHRAALIRGGASRLLMVVYRCRFCRGWHVGHRARRRR